MVYNMAAPVNDHQYGAIRGSAYRCQEKIALTAPLVRVFKFQAINFIAYPEGLLREGRYVESAV